MPKNTQTQKPQSNQDATCFSPALLDQALKDYRGPEDFEGVFQGLKKALVERALGGELTHHLGYKVGEEKPTGQSNCRNGKTPKTVRTEAGELKLEVPRDRDGSFEPQLIKKGERRLSRFDEKVIALYARGLTVREIQGYLEELYGMRVSPDLISEVTDEVLEEVREWQSRPLERLYPVIFFDALRVKIRDEGVVKNKAVYLALGILPDGTKDVLGIWIEQSEGAKFWLKVMNEIKNRGVHDVLIAVVDGLQGFPEAITAVFPDTQVQTCLVHLIRNSLEFAAWKGRKALAAALKAIYRAPTLTAAEAALDAFEAGPFGVKYPPVVALWRRHWQEIIPFFAYPAEIRRIIYTTNAIESLHMRLRKIIKTRGHFPTDEAALKLLYLALRNITREWKMPPREWKAAMTQFAILYPERFLGLV